MFIVLSRHILRMVYFSYTRRKPDESALAALAARWYVYAATTAYLLVIAFLASPHRRKTPQQSEMCIDNRKRQDSK